MKTKLILFTAVILAAGAGIFWIAARHPFTPNSTATSGGKKILYYTCAMHPWVRESKPGPCPVCGMNLTAVYESENGKTNSAATNSVAEAGTVALEPESMSVINVQTDVATIRPVKRTLHFAGEIVGNSANAAWFQFTAYERDLQWLKAGQIFNVFVSAAPEKIYTAQIKVHGTKPFADADFDMMSGSTTLRAEISDPPIVAGNLGRYKNFQNLHAEAHVVAETEPTLTIPRSAIISRGQGAYVYLDGGNGHYKMRAVQPGRIGDEFAEVLAGLDAGEKIVTTGNLLIDSEAQLAAGQ